MLEHCAVDHSRPLSPSAHAQLVQSADPGRSVEPDLLKRPSFDLLQVGSLVFSALACKACTDAAGTQTLWALTVCLACTSPTTWACRCTDPLFHIWLQATSVCSCSHCITAFITPLPSSQQMSAQFCIAARYQTNSFSSAC